MEHDFTPVIRDILTKYFGDVAEDLFEKSPLLQYINLKTVSATRGSKARSSFANLYAIFVLVEDYLTHGFDKKGDYLKYEGAQFSASFEDYRKAARFCDLSACWSRIHRRRRRKIIHNRFFDERGLSRSREGAGCGPGRCRPYPAD